MKNKKINILEEMCPKLSEENSNFTLGWILVLSGPFQS